MHYLPLMSIIRSQYSASVPNSVHTLITAMKDLQSTLTQWSTSRASPDAVSDAYMKFGAGFNTAVYAFEGCGIDTSCVLHFPPAVIDKAILKDAEIYIKFPRDCVLYLSRAWAKMLRLLHWNYINH